MESPSRSMWLAAGLLGVPPAIGVYLAALRVLGSRSHVIAVLAGVLTLVGMIGSVIYLGTTGEIDADAKGR